VTNLHAIREANTSFDKKKYFSLSEMSFVQQILNKAYLSKILKPTPEKPE